MRDELVHTAARHVEDRVQLVDAAVKLARAIHKSNTRMQDGIDEALGRIGLCEAPVVQELDKLDAPSHTPVDAPVNQPGHDTGYSHRPAAQPQDTQDAA